jgi:integrase
LDDFVTKTWAPTHGVTLALKTRKHYALLYDHHIAPTLGLLQLRAIRAETISRWQADRLAAGAGPVAVRQALDLLGSVLQRAVESERIAANPVRLVRRARLPRRKEVRPLAPSDVERMRAAASQRDATLFSVLAYAGLRPGEALALQWQDIREKTKSPVPHLAQRTAPDRLGELPEHEVVGNQGRIGRSDRSAPERSAFGCWATRVLLSRRRSPAYPDAVRKPS